MNIKKLMAILGFGLGIALSPLSAGASQVSFSFEKLTNNNTEDLGIGGSNQLTMTVWDDMMANAEFGTMLGSNEVLFTFENAVGTASNISEVYIEDGLLGPATLHNSLGGFTNFTSGTANPADLPGWNTADPSFVATSNLSADASGNPINGINASADILGLSYIFTPDYADFDAIITALELGDPLNMEGDQSLRVGLHIRSIGVAGGSDSYINDPTSTDGAPVVPIPAAIWLFGSAILGMVGIGRVRRNTAARIA